jgi:tRNA (guanine37-N1)-methyltransferase
LYIDIITVLPELLESPFKHSILKRAADKHLLQIQLHDLRNYATDKHRQVDDYQFGGGAGMVMMIEPIDRCIAHLKSQRNYDEIIYMSPDGELLTQALSNRLSLCGNLIILCGHYKGIDERVRQHLITREISIGDYVLSGGELAAAVLVDSIGRLIPGVLSDETSALEDSFQDHLLAPPVYTRPASYNNWAVPDVLLSGHAANIAEWRFQQSLQRTQERRPNLYKHWAKVWFFALLMPFFALHIACGNESAPSEVAQKQADTQNEAQKELQDIMEKSPQIRILSEQIKKEPKNAELFYTRGALMAQANAPNQAAFDFNRALELDSTQANYYLASADLYFSMENAAKAIQLLEIAQRRGIENPTISTQLGKYYFYLQKYADAEATLKMALLKQPQNDQARFWLGCTYRDQQKSDAAIEQLLKAVELNPQLYNAQMMLAQLYAAQNNDKAVKHYQYAAALDTTKFEADYGKAMYYQNSKQTDKALQAYRDLLLKDNQYTEAYFNIGYIYFEQQKYEQALQNFNIAVRTSPAYANAYYMRGLCAEKLGKKEDARKDYDKALTFDPKHEKAQKAFDNLK